MRSAALLALVACLTATLSAAEPGAPPADPGVGLLFHASFDRNRRADVAVGADLPFLADYERAARGEKGGKLVPGVFGTALTGTERGGLGDYAALGNFDPERGTIAFFIREAQQTYGFEPFVVGSVDPYYWTMYLRLSDKENRLSAWFANEVYKPVVVDAPRAARLKENAWHHIAVAWDQAYGARYYFDGQEVASNWGRACWFSRGLDPATIALEHSDNVGYDEVYVFDRPLTSQQIAQLRTENVPPTFQELAPLTYDEGWVRNRRRELSWVGEDQNMPALKLGAGESNAVRQVVPVQARCVKKECNIVFDGKPGNGWPPLYNYEFNKGNGLHVETPEPFDYMVTEGWFAGRIYDHRTLTEDGEAPWLTASPSAYTSRHRLPGPHPAGWLSFFKSEMEDKGKLTDK